MTAFAKIKQWNQTRKLLDKDFNIDNELAMIQEEILESCTDMKSEEARQVAQMIIKKEVTRFKVDDLDPEQVVDAFADIIVFATGAIYKLGYDTDKVMEEVIKEISSRVGTIKEGKFVKDTSDLAKKRWHTADFKKCK